MFRSLSGSFSADNLFPPLFGMPFSCVQQNIEQHVISPQRVLVRRSVGGSSTLFSGFLMNLNGTWFSSSCVCSSVTLHLSPCDASIQVLSSSRHSLCKPKGILVPVINISFTSRSNTNNESQRRSRWQYPYVSDKSVRSERERSVVLHLLENDMHENANEGNGQWPSKRFLLCTFAFVSW